MQGKNKDELKVKTVKDVIAEEMEKPINAAAEKNIESADENKKPAEDISKMENDIKALNEQIKRMQADFENYKNRLARDTEENRKYASEKLICQELELLDNLERAIKSADETKDIEAFKKGVELIYKKMKDIFEKEGLKEIKCVGAPYDPKFAEVMMCEDNPEAGDDMVTQELEKGYTLRDKVIRPAKVKVCKKLGQTEDREQKTEDR